MSNDYANKKWFWAFAFWFAFPIIQIFTTSISQNITIIMFISSAIIIWLSVTVQNLIIIKPNFKQLFKLTVSPLKLFLYFLTGFLYNFIVTTSISLVEKFFSRTVSEQNLVDTFLDLAMFEKIFFVIIVISIVPIAEELIYRNFILNWLKQLFSNHYISSLVCGLWFGLSHYLFDPSAPIVIIPISILGFLASYITIKHKSLVPSIMLHAGFNSFVVMLLLLK